MDPEAVYEQCVRKTEQFVHDAGFDEVVIGLSGGIDSSLVAVIAADALGASSVHGVLMPGPYSSESSVIDATDLAKALDISSMTISIDEPYAAFAHVLADALGEALGGLAAENTQARCRMICLMALSNARGWMMLNTGNRSEAAMGYSTLYGDTAGAFAPLGGLYKTEVYQLARWRNEQAERKGLSAPIPANVMLKPPSAELSPNQSDEASMGVDYPTLDAILRAYLDDGCSIEDIVKLGFDRKVVMMVVNRYNSYEYKRAAEPPAVTF